MIKKKFQLTIPNFAGYFLLTGLIFLVFLLVTLYLSFLDSLIFAAFFATILYPLFKWLRRIIGGRGRIASLITCTITLLIIAIPITFFATLLTMEGINAFKDISFKIQSGFFDQYFVWWHEGNWFYEKYQELLPYVLDTLDLKTLDLDLIGKAGDMVKNWGIWIGENTLLFIGNIFWFFFALIIFFFALYYFFKDGDLIISKIKSLSPLPAKHENAIFKKFKEVSLAMLFGIFFTAVIQGTLAGIGYAVVGMNNPIFWATATAFFSLVPLFGTAIIWVPASLFLIVTGNYVGGVGLLLWGVSVVATVDNFIRPYLIEGKAPVHPLMTFLAVLGGIFVFGLKGIIFGPIILNLLLAFLHIYELEYAKVLKH